MADALANLAATLALGAEEVTLVPVCNKWVVPPTKDEPTNESNAITVCEIDKEDVNLLSIFWCIKSCLMIQNTNWKSVSKLHASSTTKAHSIEGHSMHYGCVV